MKKTPAKENELIGAMSKETLHEPNGRVTVWMNSIRRANGFGRWVYCKYCYKNVRPVLGGENQVTCGKCGAGLSRDFFNLDCLRRWWAIWLRVKEESVYDETKRRFVHPMDETLRAIEREDDDSPEGLAWFQGHLILGKKMKGSR